jgi:hypothetical protein
MWKICFLIYGNCKKGLKVYIWKWKRPSEQVAWGEENVSITGGFCPNLHRLSIATWNPPISIHCDPDGYWWPPTYSNWLLVSIFVQHVFLYCFIIVSSTLLGLSEASHILQVDTGGLSPNPTGLFCMFSCQHILLYFQGCFEALNIVFLTRHSQTVDRVRV